MGGGTVTMLGTDSDGKRYNLFIEEGGTTMLTFHNFSSLDEFVLFVARAGECLGHHPDNDGFVHRAQLPGGKRVGTRWYTGTSASDAYSKLPVLMPEQVNHLVRRLLNEGESFITSAVAGGEVRRLEWVALPPDEYEAAAAKPELSSEDAPPK